MIDDASKLSASLHEPNRDGGPREAAHYLAVAIAELALLARRHGHDMLGYLLDMAVMEAKEASQRPDRRYPSG